MSEYCMGPNHEPALSGRRPASQSRQGMRRGSTSSQFHPCNAWVELFINGNLFGTLLENRPKMTKKAIFGSL